MLVLVLPCHICIIIPYLYYHTILVLPYHTIPYHTIPYHAIPCHAMPCHAMPCHAMPCHTIPYHTIPYHTIHKKFYYISSAFKGKLRSIDEKDKWLRLKFDILDVFRESITKKVTKKTNRIIYEKNTNCDCPRFAGKIDSDFLIMGDDIGLQAGSKVVMGETVFVKEWPSKGSDFYRKFLNALRKGC